MGNEKIIEGAIGLGVTIVVVGGLLFWLKSVFRQRREEVKKRFRRINIIRQHNVAHFYGKESIGHVQARGNGVLVLTADELYFLQALPRREFVIPVGAITKVSNPRSHLGKSNMCKLLRVDFVIKRKEDAIAWNVDDVDAWTKAVEEARGAAPESD